MAIKGTLYGLTKTKSEIDGKEQFKSMIKEVNTSGVVVIDGRNIAAGSIFANQISADAITAKQIKSDSITTDHISTAGLSADIIKAGMLTSSNGVTKINMSTGDFNFGSGKVTLVGNNLSLNVDSLKITNKAVAVQEDLEKESRYNAIKSLIGKSTMMNKDSSFNLGTNAIGLYNNSANGNVTMTRELRTSGHTNPSGSLARLKFTHTGVASPNIGGFSYANTIRANVQFLYRFVALAPAGYYFEFGTNAIGVDAKLEWLTSDKTTGKWEEYVFLVTAGSSGDFRSTGFFSLVGKIPTPAAPLVWYLDTAESYDLSKNVQEQFLDIDNKASNAKGKTDAWTFPNTTEINGGSIRTNTITAKEIAGKTITASHIATGSLTASDIKTGMLESKNGVSKINMDTGDFSFGGGKISLVGNKITLNVDSLSINAKPVATQDYTKSTNEDIQTEISNALETKADRDAFELALADLALAKSQAEDALKFDTYTDFIAGYESYKDSIVLDQQLASDALQSVLDTVVSIENNMGLSAEKWKFIDTSITNAEDEIKISSKASAMSVLISPDRISFFDNLTEVAFISDKVLQINHGIFLMSVQIGAHLVSSLPENTDITVVQWVGLKKRV